MSDTDEVDTVNIFEEPEGFYEPEKEPSSVSYRTSKGEELSLRLVGQSPLWGHLLWNAGRTFAQYLEINAVRLVEGTNVLELGAGAGLPSLICAINGAKCVVVTDYPDADLIENLDYNINHCTLLPQSRNIYAQGYLWGASTESLTSYLDAEGQQNGFDLLILGDLLFNHSEHVKLLETVKKTLRKAANTQALVFFTPYRPWLLHKDLAFFDLARNAGFVVERLFENVMDDVMFKNDPGVGCLEAFIHTRSM